MPPTKRRVLSALVSVCVATTALSSCSKILGVSDYRTAPSDAGREQKRTDASGSDPYASPGCRRCITDNCVAERAACDGDGECPAFAACGFACNATDGACLYDCLQLLRGKNTAASALIACEFRSCSADCVSCGGPFSGLTRDCASCAIDDSDPNGLCDLTTRCLGEPRCNAYLACVASSCNKLGVPDPECRLTCGGRYPAEARTYFQGVGGRYFQGCQVKCSAGKNWDCVMPAVWPPVSGKTARVTLHVEDPPPDASAAPVRVRACGGLDYSCASPIDDRQTGADGTVTFELAQNAAAGSYYYEVYKVQPESAAPYMIYFPWEPTVGDVLLGFPGAPFPPSSLDAAVASRGDPLRDVVKGGIVTALVGDCVGGWADLNSLAPEITVTASSGGDAYYGFPPNVSFTGGGQASFINVPSGSASIAVQHHGTSIATGVVPVRAGILTYVTFNDPEGL